MNMNFSADEFWAANPKERIAKCREMAVDAERRALNAKGEARSAYAELARQWRILGDELESWDDTAVAGRSTSREPL